MTEPDQQPPAARPDSQGIGIVGTSIIVFILGVVVGIPVANFGADVLVRYAGEVFAILFGVFLIIVLIAGIIAVFRKQIWGAVFHRAEIEMDRFARPLADVARFAAEQKVEQATHAARDLAELVLARYAWVSTRRWLLGTITGLIAAIAALAGSALLFQQNQLLRGQNVLMTEQTGRLTEQNKLLEAQIELGEAQRSATIVPEILNIGAKLGEESQALGAESLPHGVSATQLSSGLQVRIVAASNMARPYRFLNAGLIDIDDADLYRSALLRRSDLLKPDVLAQMQGAEKKAAAGELIDRIVSPERGQLLMLLAGAFVADTEALSFRGLDLSFAYVRMDSLKVMSLNHASLRFADFSGIGLNTVSFRGAYLEASRFQGATLDNCDFRDLPAAEATGSYRSRDTTMTYNTHMTGADFSNAKLYSVDLEGVDGLAVNFDDALLYDVDFSRASISGGTFRGAVLANVKFDGADLRGVDFDGAITDRADFITAVAAVAQPERFVAERFVVEPIARETLDTHPRSYELWTTKWPDDAQLYRIKRVKDF